MIQDVPDVGAYDKADDANLAAAERAQEREHLVDAGNQRRVGSAAAATPAALGRLSAQTGQLAVLAGPQEPAARPAALSAGRHWPRHGLGARAPGALNLQSGNKR